MARFTDETIKGLRHWVTLQKGSPPILTDSPLIRDMIETLEAQQNEIEQLRQEAHKIPKLCGNCQMGKDIKLIRREVDDYPPYRDVLRIYEIQKNHCPKTCPRYKAV